MNTLPPTLTSAASNGYVAENGVEEPERQQPMPEQTVKGPRAQDTDAPVNAVGVNEVGFRQKRAERANYQLLQQSAAHSGGALPSRLGRSPGYKLTCTASEPGAATSADSPGSSLESLSGSNPISS